MFSNSSSVSVPASNWFLSALSISQARNALSALSNIPCRVFRLRDGIFTTKVMVVIVVSVCFMSSLMRCNISAYLVVILIGKPIPGGTAWGIGSSSINFRAAFNPLIGGLRALGMALNLAILASIDDTWLSILSIFFLVRLRSSEGHPSTLSLLTISNIFSIILETSSPCSLPTILEVAPASALSGILTYGIIL